MNAAQHNSMAAMNAAADASAHAPASPSPSPSPPALECRGVSKVFAHDAIRVTALQDIDLRVAAGERIALVGASGSGKSTLLHILGGLSPPSAGQVRVAGRDINALSPAAAGALRNRALGFVYQFHHLLPEFTALENVAMPLLIRRMPRGDALARAEGILTRVGLGHRIAHKPGELSGGERQRAAVARALVTAPQCVLADEPTGNLDSQTAASIHDLLLELNLEHGASLVVATHDPKLASKMTRQVRIKDGTIADGDNG